MFQGLNDKILQLSNESDSRKSLDTGIELANEFLKVLDPKVHDLRTGEDALDDAIPNNQFPNQKVESWFSSHPYFTGDKVALRFYSSDLVETKFYWLSDVATKARVSAGVMLTPNWEDSDLTKNDNYKLGIDFFLTAKADALLVVISNNGNLRLLELSGKLTHTQIEILKKLSGSLALENREQIHKTLWDALALSEVNKKFYVGIAEQFNILLNHLVADGRDPEDSKLFASRLLGRLLFLWFLRRKNIIQEQFGYFELEGNDATKYYETKLKKLFFATLNKPTNERTGEDDITPYLNGGLFEAHDNDWVHQTVIFPTGFFNGLYEHLEKYNFTTDESSPEYEQVAIDPEMLGRVFESLLATQLTETGQQARKAKGAFYTPREIVNYMCRESLRQYLYTKLDNETWNDGVDKLLDSSDSEWELSHSNSKRNLWGEANRNTVPLQVIGALNELKVLDPACGSGAFPMGMLQLILKTYERLDPTYDTYKKKLQIIQENIYGVDIEPMAVEIARLRAWLSLVVDEDGRDDVQPLPNLDFKFVCANSLIPLDQQTGIFSDSTLHEKLAEVRNKFFNARKPESKDNWKKKYYELASNGQTTIGGDNRDSQLKSFDPFKNSHNAEFFDPDYMFGVSEFDVVIGNPPYIRIHKQDNSKKKLMKELYKSAVGDYDLYVLFFERSLQILVRGGILTLITPDKYLVRDYGKELRKLILDKKIVALTDISRATDSFSAAAYPLITIISNIRPSEDIRVTTVNTIKELNDTSNQVTISHDNAQKNNLIEIIDPEDLKLINKVYENSKPLSSLLTEKQIFCGTPRAKDYKHWGTRVITNNSSVNPVKLPLYVCASISPYKLRTDKPVRALGNKVTSPFFDNTDGSISKQRWSDFSHSPKILIRGNDKRVTAALDTTGSVFVGVYAIKVEGGIMSIYESILAQLNSSLVNWVYGKQNPSVRIGGGYFSINSPQLLRLPTIKPTELINDQLKDLVGRLSNGGNDADKIQSQIDRIIYKFYNLTPEEIKIIEDSTK